MENKQKRVMVRHDYEFMSMKEAEEIAKKLEKEDVFIKEEEDELE